MMTFIEQKQLLEWARANRVAAIKLSDDNGLLIDVTFYPKADEGATLTGSGERTKGWDKWVDERMGLDFEPGEHRPTTIEYIKG